MAPNAAEIVDKFAMANRRAACMHSVASAHLGSNRYRYPGLANKTGITE